MNADRLESISIMQIKWNIAWNYVALDFLVTPKKGNSSIFSIRILFHDNCEVPLMMKLIKLNET